VEQAQGGDGAAKIKDSMNPPPPATSSLFSIPFLFLLIPEDGIIHDVVRFGHNILFLPSVFYDIANRSWVKPTKFTTHRAMPHNGAPDPVDRLFSSNGFP